MTSVDLIDLSNPKGGLPGPPVTPMEPACMHSVGQGKGILNLPSPIRHGALLNKGSHTCRPLNIPHGSGMPSTLVYSSRPLDLQSQVSCTQPTACV